MKAGVFGISLFRPKLAASSLSARTSNSETLQILARWREKAIGALTDAQDVLLYREFSELVGQVT
jgi:hypothetical protein